MPTLVGSALNRRVGGVLGGRHRRTFGMAQPSGAFEHAWPRPGSRTPPLECISSADPKPGASNFTREPYTSATVTSRFLAGRRAQDIGTLAEFTERDRTLEAHRLGEYVLWFEADLYDQLQLIQVLAKLKQLDVPPERITLICIGEHLGIGHFGGLGQLDATQLGRLPAVAAQPMTTTALEHTRRTPGTQGEHPIPPVWATSPHTHRANCASSVRPSTGSAGSTRRSAMACH